MRTTLAGRRSDIGQPNHRSIVPAMMALPWVIGLSLVPFVAWVAMSGQADRAAMFGGPGWLSLVLNYATLLSCIVLGWSLTVFVDGLFGVRVSPLAQRVYRITLVGALTALGWILGMWAGLITDVPNPLAFVSASSPDSILTRSALCAPALAAGGLVLGLVLVRQLSRTGFSQAAG